jgi:hypothetical protein
MAAARDIYRRLIAIDPLRRGYYQARAAMRACFGNPGCMEMRS